jgi:hypothetical protein
VALSILRASRLEKSLRWAFVHRRGYATIAQVFLATSEAASVGGRNKSG